MTDTDEFPQYDPPSGVPVADHKQAGPLTKMVSRMLKPKFKLPRGKGIQSDQSVHVKHKKVKYY